MATQGSAALWRVATRLAKTGSVSCPQGSTTDVLVETYPDTDESTGHAYYLTDVYTRDAAVFAFSDSSGIEAPGVFGPHIYVGHYRKYVAASAEWEVYLRFTNLTVAHPAAVVVYYQMYRWLGLH